MPTDKSGLDLKSLSLRADRTDRVLVAPRRHVLSRYVLPAGLIVGFAGLMAWTAREAWLPRKPVTVVPVLISRAEFRTGGTPLFKAAGWIEPRPTPIRVTALAPGVVEELLVVEDQLVTAGEPIARLVDEDAQLALEQADAHLCILKTDVTIAEAALAAAKTNLEVPAHLEFPVAEAEADLRVVEAELSNLPNQQVRAAARLKLAGIELQTKQKAAAAVSALLVAQAQAEFDAASAEVQELSHRQPVLEQQREALARKLEAARTRLRLKTDEQQAHASAIAKVHAAAAHVREAEVALATAQLRLERMTIKAPVTGRVLDLVAAPGSQMMEGISLTGGQDGNTVVTMYCPDQLQVRVDVRFEDLPRVGRDQPVEVRSPALPEPLHGKVLFMTGSANIQKNTLEVKVSLEQAPDVLKPEMLVDATFLAPEQPAGHESQLAEHRLFVPRSLVDASGGSPNVWVLDPAASIARRQSIQLGPVQTPQMLEVTSGLDPSSRLIVSGRDGLLPGERVEVRGEEPSLDWDELSTSSESPKSSSFGSSQEAAGHVAH